MCENVRSLHDSVLPDLIELLQADDFRHFLCEAHLLFHRGIAGSR